MFSNFFKSLMGNGEPAPLTDDKTFNYLQQAHTDGNSGEFRAILELAATEYALGSGKGTDGRVKLEQEIYSFALAEIKKVLAKHETSTNASLLKLKRAVEAYDQLSTKKRFDIMADAELKKQYALMPKDFQGWLLRVSTVLEELAEASSIDNELLKDMTRLNNTLIKKQVECYKGALPFFSLREFLEKNAKAFEDVNTKLKTAESELEREKKNRPASVTTVNTKTAEHLNVRMRLSLVGEFISEPRALLVELLICHLMQKLPPTNYMPDTNGSSHSNGTTHSYHREGNAAAYAREYKGHIMQWIKALIYCQKKPEEIIEEIKSKFQIVSSKFIKSLGDDVVRYADFFPTKEDGHPIDLSPELTKIHFQSDELEWAKSYAARLVNWLKCLSDTYGCETNTEFTSLYTTLNKKATFLKAEFERAESGDGNHHQNGHMTINKGNGLSQFAV